MDFRIGLLEYAGRPFPLHEHKCYEIISYLQGAGTIFTSQGELPVKAGSIVIVPTGVSHRTSAGTGLKSIYISGDFGGMLHLDAPALVSDNEEGEGLALVRMIYRNRNAGEDYVAALCSVLTHFLLRNLEMEDSVSCAVRKIVYEISESFCDDSVDLNLLLNRSGYAEDYIRAHFKRITGKTPTEFLHEQRIKRACFLIEIYRSALPLGEIAVRCGYTDYAMFSRKFKAHQGISPREYKRAVENAAPVCRTAFAPQKENAKNDV